MQKHLSLTCVEIEEETKDKMCEHISKRLSALPMGVLTVTFVQRGMKSPTLVYRINRLLIIILSQLIFIVWPPSPSSLPLILPTMNTRSTHTVSCGAAWKGKETRKTDGKNVDGRLGGGQEIACPEPVDLCNLLPANCGFSHICFSQRDTGK